MFPAWKHEDCFPIVKDTILRLCEERKGWVLFDEILDELLEDGTVKLAIGDISWKDEDAREIVSNVVAWFSQKITEYENGTLREHYKQIDLIEEAYSIFDRKELDGRYAYKLRVAPDVIPEGTDGKVTKGSIVRQKRLEEKRRQDAFRRFVEDLKKQKVTGEEYRETGEEYRERVKKWQQRADQPESGKSG